MPPDQSHQNPSIPGTVPISEDAQTTGPIPDRADVSDRPRFRLFPCVGVALLAGLISFGFGEASYGLFRWDDARDVKAAHQSELSRLGPYAQNEFITKKMMEARSVAESRQAALAFGVLGAILGLGLGLSGGLVSLAGTHMRAGLTGMVLGGGLGVVAALLCVPRFYEHLTPGGGLGAHILMYAGMFIPLGAACGMALGMGLAVKQAAARCALGGMLGATLAVIVLVIANSLAFPLDQEPAPVPAERIGRLIIHLSVALLVALFATLSLPRLNTAARSRSV
jgi:hypothetical protein